MWQRFWILILVINQNVLEAFKYTMRQYNMIYKAWALEAYELGPYVIKSRYEVKISLESVVSRTMGKSRVGSDSVALQLTR